MAIEMRRAKQALSREVCEEVLARNSSGVLALNDQARGFPYQVPMGYSYAEGKLVFHCAESGRKIDLAHCDGRASFTVIDADDVVPERFTTRYRSVVCVGTLRNLDGEEACRQALRLLAEHYWPGHPEAVEVEVEQCIAHCAVLELDIEQMTGKESRDLARERQQGIYDLARGEYEEAAQYWISREAARSADENMPAEELRAEIEGFLASHNTCALATGAGFEVRCTPLEYSWCDGCIWIFSEGGLKFRGLAASKRVCLAVYEPYEGFGKLSSVQVTAHVELVAPDSPEFAAAAQAKGIPAERVLKVAQMLHLLKVVPVEADYLCSALAEKGYASRQHFTW